MNDTLYSGHKCPKCKIGSLIFTSIEVIDHRIYKRYECTKCKKNMRASTTIIPKENKESVKKELYEIKCEQQRLIYDK